MIASQLYFSIVFGLLAMFAYGIMDYMGSILTKKENPVRTLFWYSLLSTLLLSVGILFFKIPHMAWVYVPVFIWLSIQAAYQFLIFYKSLKLGKVAVVVPIANTYSIVIVLTGLLFLHEVITPLLWVGISLTILGTILVSFKLRDIVRLRINRAVPGVKYALLTMFLFGTFSAAVGVLSKLLGWFWPIFIISIGCTVTLFVHASIKKIRTSFPVFLTGMLPLYAVVGTSAFIFYSVGANHGQLSLVGPLAAAAPLVTVMLARIFVKERMAINQAVGVAFILIGLVIMAS